MLDDLTAVDPNDPVELPLDQGLILLRDHQSATLEIELHQARNEPGADTGSEPEGGLVDQVHLGVAHQTPPDREHPPLAAGQCSCGLLHALTEPREDLQDSFAALLAVPPAGCERARVEVVADAQAREERVALRNHDDPGAGELVRRRVNDRLAVQEDLACPPVDEAHDRSHQGRLSVPVQTDEADPLRRSDAQIDRVEHTQRSVAGRELSDLQRWGHAACAGSK